MPGCPSVMASAAASAGMPVSVASFVASAAARVGLPVAMRICPQMASSSDWFGFCAKPIEARTEFRLLDETPADVSAEVRPESVLPIEDQLKYI